MLVQVPTTSACTIEGAFDEGMVIAILKLYQA
jgi:hypothetical protein